MLCLFIYNMFDSNICDTLIHRMASIYSGNIIELVEVETTK